MTSQAPCEEGTATLQLLRQACVKNRDCRYGGRSSLLSTRLTVKDVLDFASSERAVINGQFVDQSRERISAQIRLFTSSDLCEHRSRRQWTRSARHTLELSVYVERKNLAVPRSRQVIKHPRHCCCLRVRPWLDTPIGGRDEYPESISLSRVVLSQEQLIVVEDLFGDVEAARGEFDPARDRESLRQIRLDWKHQHTVRETKRIADFAGDE